MPLRDLDLQLQYDPDSCPDVVGQFYAPALGESVSYDRATYTFSAAGLSSAAAGLAGLLRNGGRVRLICHYEMEEATARAIMAGQAQASEAMLARVAPEDLTRVSPDDIRAKSQLGLLTWLIANRRLEIRIALYPSGIFHEKTGVMEDARGDRISFVGSPNETEAGWSKNYEGFKVFKSWEHPEFVKIDAAHFDALWNGESRNLCVIPMPDEYEAYLKRVAPPEPPVPGRTPQEKERDAYWQRIRDALESDPESTLATIPAELWPHQESFRRARIGGECRVLVADEVGLGKTMQAAILLKTRINQGRGARVLILTTKPARDQWQQELYRKFCLDVPILETGASPRLSYATPKRQTVPAPDPPWDEPRLICSYRWLVWNVDAFLAAAPRYDLVVVDEAHHARYQGTRHRREPNQFLRLLQRLSQRTSALLLLTATPMQTDISDLRALLGLLDPDGWTEEALKDFYDDASDLTIDRIKQLKDLYVRAAVRPERSSGWEERLIWSGNPMMFDKRAANSDDRRALLHKMRETAPTKRLMSRHTRGLLERYQREGRLDARMPGRKVRSVSIRMNAGERKLYDGIDDIVRACYDDPRRVNATAMGFVMTIYRRRLGSSPRAYAQTARNLLERRPAQLEWSDIDPREDILPDEPLPTLTLTSEQEAMLRQTIDQAGALPRSDTKYAALLQELEALMGSGHRCIIIFTEYRDTQIYLQERMKGHPRVGVVNAIWGGDRQEDTSRAERIAQVRKDGGLLICTETAAESLNLQFCSAIVNYDIPWNPMTIEQRIGRIDRIGQARESVDVVNLFYDDTAEWDAYQAMDERLYDIGRNVGPYRDILRSQLEGIIKRRESLPSGPRARAIRKDLAAIEPDTRVDLDSLNSELSTTSAPAPAIQMRDLQRCLDTPFLLPEGWSVAPEGGPHWRVTTPDGASYTVTTDRTAYEYAAGRVEWFGPGSPAFPDVATRG